MPIRTNKTRELPIAYVLDEETLSRLLQTMNEEVSQEVDWFVSLSDGSSLHTGDLAEVTNILNTKSRAITRIRCHAKSTTEPKEADVTFRNYGAMSGSGSIAYEVTGDDRTVVYLSGKLEEFLFSLRQWYTVICRPISGLLIQWFILAVVLTPIMCKLAPKLNHLSATRQLELSLVTGVIVASLIIALLKYLFPISFFVLGKGKERYDSVKQVRTGVGVGFLLALPVGMLAIWFMG